MKIENAECFYILVSGDSYGSMGNRISSHDLLRHRLNKKLWPMFKRTSHRTKIKPRDKVVFYLGGQRKGSQSFAATAEIGEIVEWDPEAELIDMEGALTDPPSIVLELKKINYLSDPISIKPLIRTLEFIKKPEIWQVYMQHGCIGLTEGDYRLAVSGRAG